MKVRAGAALELRWSGIMAMLCEVMLWLHHGYVVAAATGTASGKRERLCRPGGNKHVCRSYGSSSLLRAS